ncbi:MAG: hypothetical protein V7752_04865 [Halopseudomonas sp.]
MSHRAIIRSMVLVLASIFTTQALGSNLLFLSHSVLSELSQQDGESLRSAIHHALDQSEDKKTSIWLSDSQQLEVKIQPMASYQYDQKNCRKARFLLSRNNRKLERYQFDYCQEAEGWNIAHTPASSFNKHDWELLGQMLQGALNDNPDGQPSSWTNHKSKNSGVLVPSSSEMRAGKSCRQTAITLFNKHDQASNGSYLFCLESDGSWKRFIE